MAGFDQLDLEDGSRVQSVLSKLDSSSSSTLTRQEVDILRAALDESKALSLQTEKLLKIRAEDADSLAFLTADLEKQLSDMESSYADLLIKKIGEAGGDAITFKTQMDELMNNMKYRGEQSQQSFRKLLEEREEENKRLRAVVEEHKNNSSSLKVLKFLTL